MEPLSGYNLLPLRCLHVFRKLNYVWSPWNIVNLRKLPLKYLLSFPLLLHRPLLHHHRPQCQLQHQVPPHRACLQARLRRIRLMCVTFCLSILPTSQKVRQSSKALMLCKVCGRMVMPCGIIQTTIITYISLMTNGYLPPGYSRVMMGWMNSLDSIMELTDILIL